MPPQKNILWLNEITGKDISFVGQKIASLGELHAVFGKRVLIPSGFALTIDAYRSIGTYNGLDQKIDSLLHQARQIKNTAQIAKKLQNLFLTAKIPESLEKEILDAYAELSLQHTEKESSVAVRASVVASSEESFAGLQETYLNIKGERQLLAACKKVYASLFTERALHYRREKGIQESDVKIAVAVQRMIAAQTTVSGIMTTAEINSGNTNLVVINATQGLGKKLTRGEVTSSEYHIFKPTLLLGKRTILKRDVVSGCNLADNEVFELAKLGIEIEKHYCRPMNIEWAKDPSGQFFILDAFPLSPSKKKRSNAHYILKSNGPLLLKGTAVGREIASGRVFHFSTQTHNRFEEGDVLVAPRADPSLEPLMRKASALVTEQGSRTSHVALMAREIGIPAIVGAADAMKTLRNGQQITVDCSQGETGSVFGGLLSHEKNEILQDSIRTQTRLHLNVGNPSQAFEEASLPSDGVGLARLEFIINARIGIHPLALVNYEDIKQPALRKKIKERTFHYKNKADFFVDILAEGVGTIAAAFHPRQVTVRFSDFKTNEYTHLLGGELYEPEEENPVLGWRGASRYYTPPYEDAFRLECRAIKKARETLGFENINLLIPFCRTPEEAKKVLQIMHEEGLERSKTLKVFLMCEVPSNVLLADKFLELVDGYSIGSNDLTQLTYGVDRDSQRVQSIASEKDLAVKRMIAHVIKTCKKMKKSVAVCGDAASTFKEFTEFLVEHNIDSISVSPDAFFHVKEIIVTKENHLHAKPRLFSKLKMN